MQREEIIAKLKELLAMSGNKKLRNAFTNAIRTLETTGIPAWYVLNYVLDETGIKITCKSDA